MQKNIFKNSLVVGIMILFVGASVIPSMGNSIVVKQDSQGDKTTFKGTKSGGYIQDLIDNASDGDTIYIPSGTYYECIVINKSISLVGEDKNTTIIDGNRSGTVVSIVFDWVNISGFTIQNSSIYGLSLSSNSNTITNNIIMNNRGGGCVGAGISLSGNNNIIFDNIITKNGACYGYGLDIFGNNNIIFHNTITNNGGIRYVAGISLAGDNNTISDNNITNNRISSSYGYGISLGGENNTISDNTVKDNGDGINLGGDKNTIFCNNLSKNYHGLILSNSPNTVMRNNTFLNNTYNFGVEGGDISTFYQDIDTTNTINGKQIYYLIEQSNLEFDDSMSIGYLCLVSCKNISVKNLILTNNGQGLLLVNTFYSIINNLTLYNNSQHGINLYYSLNNIITNCYIHNNEVNGIYFLDSSNDIIYGNNISNNNGGIFLWNTINNNITGNNINSNNEYGIYLGYSSGNNNITGNNISSNNYNGIYLDYSSGNNITDNNITNNRNGINLYHSSGNNITGNNINSNNYNGIWSDESNGNIITGNNISSNNGNGIFLDWYSSGNNIITDNNINNNGNGIHLYYYSDNNIITGNNIANNDDGIILEYSSKTVMRNNTIQNNNYNFEIFGSEISDYYQDIDTTNTINGKPIYYLVEQSNLVLDDSMSIGYLCLVSCKNISAKNLIFTNNIDGLLILNTSYSIIENLTLYNNSQYGIHLYASSSNTITGNNIISNNKDGIHLDDSSGNTIISNSISSNNNNGIYLGGSGNTITGNNISSNNGYGIYSVWYNNDNIIYHNNFINNEQNAYDTDISTWYNAELQEGNYWSDYTGIDFNSDGIGDIPYDIPGGRNKDLYPFMESDGWLKEPEFLKAFIVGKITNLIAAGKYITFGSVKIRVITFKPFSFHRYVSGEKLILSKNYLGLIGVRFIFAMCEIVIRF